MKVKIILTAMSILICLNNIQGQCSRYDYDKVRSLGKNVVHGYINEYFHGGSSINIDFDKSSCDYNTYTKEYSIKTSINWEGNINNSNFYSVEGVLTFSDKSAVLDPIYMNTTANDYLIIAGITRIAFTYILDNYNNESKPINKNTRSKPVNEIQTNSSISLNDAVKKKDLKAVKRLVDNGIGKHSLLDGTYLIDKIFYSKPARFIFEEKLHGDSFIDHMGGAILVSMIENNYSLTGAIKKGKNAVDRAFMYGDFDKAFLLIEAGIKPLEPIESLIFYLNLSQFHSSHHRKLIPNYIKKFVNNGYSLTTNHMFMLFTVINNNQWSSHPGTYGPKPEEKYEILYDVYRTVIYESDELLFDELWRQFKNQYNLQKESNRSLRYSQINIALFSVFDDELSQYVVSKMLEEGDEIAYANFEVLPRGILRNREARKHFLEFIGKYSNKLILPFLSFDNNINHFNFLIDRESYKNRIFTFYDLVNTQESKDIDELFLEEYEDQKESNEYQEIFNRQSEY